MERSLALIAAPLGNYEDLSPRAQKAIENSDLVFCEDSRKFLRLCQDLQLDVSAKKIVPLPGQTEHEIDFSKFKSYSRWIFMSDAGTPVVNDPGRSLLLWAREENFKVTALPGPSAPIFLWQASGGFGLPFCFAGYVPKKTGVQSLEKFFETALQGGSFCFFETKHQVLDTLQFLKEHPVWSKQKLALGREMTKVHEEILLSSPAEIYDFLKTKVESKEGIGEMTFLLEGKKQKETLSSVSIQDLAELRNSPPKQAAKIMARLTGQSVQDCYQSLLKKDE